MPHPTVLSGYEELLEVAEAILFSVQLPAGVLDKYKLIQTEVKNRIRDAISRDSDPASLPSLRSSMQGSMHGDQERAALLSEKLQRSKQKNAELRSQVSSLEGQLAQMTQRVQQLHQMHANSAAELVAQTKHACEEAAARVAEEAEERARANAAAIRQAAHDALESERAFHASLVRKVEMMHQLFPAEYAGVQNDDTGAADRTGAAASGAAQANGGPRVQLTAFFEHTRHALNHARHLRREAADAQEEVRALRLRQPIDDTYRLAVERASTHMSSQTAQLQADIIHDAHSDARRSALLLQRDAIVAHVSDIERRMLDARAAASASSHSDAGASTIVARSSSSRYASPARARTSVSEQELNSRRDEALSTSERPTSHHLQSTHGQQDGWRSTYASAASSPTRPRHASARAERTVVTERQRDSSPSSSRADRDHDQRLPEQHGDDAEDAHAERTYA